MTTSRHQIASLQPNKFALCFFPLGNSLELCKTSLIKEGAAGEGNMVRLYWDKKNSDLPAKIILLDGMYSIFLLNCCVLFVTCFVLMSDI
jgi:hypothetical protein